MTLRVIPMGGLALCYYLNNNHAVSNSIGSFANTLFYIFALLAVGEGGFLLWYRPQLFAKPMIRRRETFEEDFAEQFDKRSRMLFAMIASISIYGYIYYALTGRFVEAVLFVILSFITFQLVRPRHSIARKWITKQKELAAGGEFLTD